MDSWILSWGEGKCWTMYLCSLFDLATVKIYTFFAALASWDVNSPHDCRCSYNREETTCPGQHTFRQKPLPTTSMHIKFTCEDVRDGKSLHWRDQTAAVKMYGPTQLTLICRQQHSSFGRRKNIVRKRSKSNIFVDQHHPPTHTHTNTAGKTMRETETQQESDLQPIKSNNHS